MSDHTTSSRDRLTELAALLAAAALRLRRRAALPPGPPEVPESAPEHSESPPDRQIPANRPRNRLDVSAETSLHGGHVVDARATARPGGDP